MEDIIEQYTPLIYSIIDKYGINDPELHDRLVQTGRIAIWKSWPKYNANKSKPLTFLWYAIRNKIVNDLRAEKTFHKKPKPIKSAVYVDADPVFEFIPDSLTKEEEIFLQNLIDGSYNSVTKKQLCLSEAQFKNLKRQTLRKLKEVNQYE